MAQSKFANIPLGTPPDHVLRELEEDERLMREAEAAEAAEASPPAAEAVKERSTDLSTIRKVAPTFPIKLTFWSSGSAPTTDSASGPVPIFVSFLSPDVSITASSISIICPSDFSIEPKGVCDLTIEYEGDKYPVSFVGGFFKFDNTGVRGISFIRKPNDD